MEYHSSSGKGSNSIHREWPNSLTIPGLYIPESVKFPSTTALAATVYIALLQLTDSLVNSYGEYEYSRIVRKYTIFM